MHLYTPIEPHHCSVVFQSILVHFNPFSLIQSAWSIWSYLVYFRPFCPLWSIQPIMLALSLSLSLLPLGWWFFMLVNISTLGWCILVLYFLSSSSQVPFLPHIVLDWFLFEFIFSLEVRILVYTLYQNTIFMAVYLNVPINYLSNFSGNYVISFDYHDNLLKRMRNLKLKNFGCTKRN